MNNKKRIITNTDWFHEYSSSYDIKKIIDADLVTTINEARSYTASDIVIINISPRLLYYHCIAKALYPKTNFWIISIDLILSKPNNIFDNIKTKLLEILFRMVNYFILYMKDWSGYKRYYKIKEEQFKYIPFKVNSYENLKDIEICDDSYIFSGGMSKRDYDTLFKAVNGLDVKLVVIVPPLEICRKHGTLISDAIPSNVTILHDDFSVNSWNECVAKAKFVVIQISKDTISPTGISTYLVAMALKKCVIITEGPATINIIPNDCAVIIKPSNIQELRNAILRVNTDEKFRSYISENGYRYAMSLKGQNRLIGDIVEFIDNNIQ